MTIKTMNTTKNEDDEDQDLQTCRSTFSNSTDKCELYSYNHDLLPSYPNRSAEHSPSFKARISRRLSSRPNALGPWSFKQVHKLGEGVSGTVALATVLRDAPLRQMRGKQVALKRIRERLRYKNSLMKHVCVEQDAHALVSGHPHIATLLGSFKTRRSYYLVVEAINGGTVKNALAIYRHRAKRQTEKSKTDPSVKNHPRARMPELVVVAIARQVAQALAFMHDSGIAHRDITPENVLLVNKLADIKCHGDVSAQVVDFGMASLFVEGVDGVAAALRVPKYGTGLYMAPEVMRGQIYDCRSADVFSLGVMLYEMVTAGKPFPFHLDDYVLEVRRRRPAFKDDEWTDVDDELKAIASSMMQAEPENRPDATQAAQVLARIENRLKRKLNETSGNSTCNE